MTDFTKTNQIFKFGLLSEPNPYGTTLTIKKHNELLIKIRRELKVIFDQAILEARREVREEKAILIYVCQTCEAEISFGAIICHNCNRTDPKVRCIGITNPTKKMTNEKMEEKINDILWQLMRHTSPLSTKKEYMESRPKASKELLNLCNQTVLETLERVRETVACLDCNDTHEPKKKILKAIDQLTKEMEGKRE